MSYRTIKRLLGETSLERKCRFLFGSGLLLLITGSFYFYYSQTKQLVFRQNRIAARLLVSPVILEHHWKWSLDEHHEEVHPDRPLDAALVETMVKELKPDDLKNYSWELLKASKLEDPASRPIGPGGYQAREEITRARTLGGC